MNAGIRLAAEVITRGGVVVYPTETLYAVGASILIPQAVERVARLKLRGPAKPLPVIIGDLEQLAMLTDWRDQRLSRLIRDFWPGPLSILVPARPGLSPLLQDPQGFTAVRWTPHPTAQVLAVLSRTPLTSTSANTAGEPPASRPEDLDPKLMARLEQARPSGRTDDPNQPKELIIRQQPFPAGGEPSTVVQIQDDGRLRIFREGAVAREQLQKAGWNFG